MNFRTQNKNSRYGTDSQVAIASGDLVCGTVPTAQLAAQPVLSAAGALTLQTGITPREMGVNPYHLTVLQFKDQPLVITDALAYASLEIYDFPVGLVTVLGSTMKFTSTTHTTIASTLKASKTVQYGVGTAVASATTLATTMIDLNPGTGQSVPTFTSSATIDVANTAVSSVLLAVGAPFNGTASAKKAYFNVAIGTGGDIDADATILLNGTVQIAWVFGGTAGLTYTP